jgi:phosphoglycolate phosphatase-like HAD superfamily hydrolase
MFKTVEAIFFDFDGVITDSVNVKTEAFAKIYKPYGKEVVNNVIMHHLANGGVSRFEKFKIYHKDFLGVDLDNQQVQALADKFHNLVVQKVIDAPFIPGALEFLVKYYLYFPLYVISATPEGEINEIIYKKELRKYFKGVYGSPSNKSKWAKYIISKDNFDPKKVIFVGDALSDYNAALNCGLHFIARIEKCGHNPFEEIIVDYKISNIFDLDKLLSSNGIK